MKNSPILSLISLLIILLGLNATALADDPSVGATKYGNASFFEKHAAFLRRAAAGPAGVVFLGDSITQGWDKVPEIWEKYPLSGSRSKIHFGRWHDRSCYNARSVALKPSGLRNLD